LATEKTPEARERKREKKENAASRQQTSEVGVFHRGMWREEEGEPLYRGPGPQERRRDLHPVTWFPRSLRMIRIRERGGGKKGDMFGCDGSEEEKKRKKPKNLYIIQ